MKQFILLLVILLSSIASYGNVTRSGNTFKIQEDVQTSYKWEDKHGIVYPIYINSKGRLYIKKVSKKTGKTYKYFLPKEAQESIKKYIKSTPSYEIHALK